MSEPTQFDQHDRAALQSINEGIATIATELAARRTPTHAEHPNFRMAGDIVPLVTALAKARGAFPTIPKNCEAEVRNAEGRHLYNFEYADLGSIIAATTPALSENGLALLYPIVNRGAEFTAIVMLMHSSGAFFESRVDFGGVQGKYGPDDQKTAGRGSYWIRYAVRGLLGLAPEDDDDGASANDKDAKVTKRDAQPKERSARAPADRMQAPDPNTDEIPPERESKAAAQARGRAKAAKAVAEATQGSTQEVEGRPLTSETSHALAAAMSAHGVGGRVANAWLAEHHQTGAGSLTSHPRGEDIGRELLSVIQSGALSPAEGT